MERFSDCYFIPDKLLAVRNIVRKVFICENSRIIHDHEDGEERRSRGNDR